MFFGGSASGLAMAVGVSDEVLAYRATIQQVAQKYGMEAYVELLMAVMMQESGGRGSDPMQAAEGGFNKKYPHVPNGITDPAYSIECGIQELSMHWIKQDVPDLPTWTASSWRFRVTITAPAISTGQWNVTAVIPKKTPLLIRI